MSQPVGVALPLNNSDRCIYVLADWENKDSEGYPIYPPGYQTGFIIGLVLCTVFIFGGAALVFWYRKNSHFQARSLPGVFAICLGSLFSCYFDFLRGILGFENFPCLLYLVLSSLSFVFCLGGLWIQNLKFLNASKFYMILFDTIDKEGREYYGSIILDENIRRQLEKLKYRSSDRYGALLLFTYSVFVLFGNSLVAAFAKEYDYFGGCTGCAISEAKTIVNLTFILLTGLLYFYTFCKIRKNTDPFNVVGEARYYIIPGFIVVVAYPAFILSFTYEEFFSDLVASFGTLVLVFIVTYYQVYYVMFVRDRLLKKKRLRRANVRFFIDDKEAYPYLQAYARDAFLSEIPVFIKDGEKWKESSYGTENSLEQAQAIYETYIADNAPLEINIPYRMKVDQKQALNLARNNGENLPSTLFDDAVLESMNLLAGQWTNFLRSEHYRAYLKVNPGFLEQDMNSRLASTAVSTSRDRSEREENHV